MSDLFSATPSSIPSASRHALILSGLRNRLFDTSRRNRLLYYKTGSRFVNLTAASMPMSRPPQQSTILFTYNSIDRQIMGMRSVLLNEQLFFKEHPYLQPQLNNVRLQAESDEKEYGFSQLHLVLAFLHWVNLKEDSSIRIQSPLLLLPVKLKRNKAVGEDKFTLEILDNVATVNPVLANHLKDLYGIELPDSVPFEQLSMRDFYEVFKTNLETASQGLQPDEQQPVQLLFADDPDAVQVYQTAHHTIDTYLKRLGRTAEDSLEPPARVSYTSPLTPAPHLWEFDTAQLVLGNFNYKKMSLVSDYNQAITQGGAHPVFSALFSDLPKAPAPIVAAHSPAEWYHVISADPAQTAAILQNRSGGSYIIQGPPGTGKSQTITNLVADFLAQGKTVLFVCEKRAALDVVYHRLQQRKLAELCCYIHDSQADKKAFIQDLKTVYDDFLKTRIDLTHLSLRRKIALEHLQRQLQLLQTYHDQQRATGEDAGIPTRQLIATLVQLQPHLPQAPATDMPAYRYWLQFGDTLEELSRALERQGAAPQLALHPFRHLGNALIQDRQAFTLINHLSVHAQGAIDHITRIIINNQIPAPYTEKLAQLMALVKTAAVLAPLAENHNLHLVDPEHKEAKRFEKAYRRYRQYQKAYKLAGKRNKHWLQKFSAQEVQLALAIVTKYETSFLRFFSGSWRRLKKQLLKAYNFPAHQLPPAFSTILEQLRDEYAAQEKVAQHQHTMQERYRADNLVTMHVGLEALRRQLGDERIHYLLQHPQAHEVVLQLSGLNNSLHQLELQLQQSLYGYEQKSLWQVQEELSAICAQAPQLQKLLPALQAFAALPLELQDTIRQVPLTPVQAQAAMAQFSLQTIYDRHSAFANTQQDHLLQAVKEITTTYQQLLNLNSDYIRATRRQQFLQHYSISNTAAGQLSPEQRLFKKSYAEGRRLLEHEMGKTIRFRSIREMASLESGIVLKDIKPVWLMSPLSVSDSLPMDPLCFDVVIFDEASQIPLEEGIPALFRAPQTIIVGDEKQMPPAQFFSSTTTEADDVTPDDDINLDAGSLLVQGAAKLPGAMLRWHYRSRYEALISYSNHAFYGADLLTIPDKTLPPPQHPLLTIQTPEEGEQYAQQVLQHSISYHYLPNGVYENRSNLPEARYIAYIVKSLLLQPVKESIGIVAFSQEQQQAIINAINALAATDRAFDAALDNAYNREEEGQYTGLFIKNLENVQGDERDIILISICYGHDRHQHMRMHFGPVNRRGGEKRLNVIFSRAKKHMAIISSIRHQHITNEHNDGARYFKRFLHYAEMVSTGHMEQARQVLDSLLPPGKVISTDTDVASLTTRQVKAALEAAGYIVDEAVGQSSFRCSLAVKKQATDTQYSLGILLDDAAHYQNNNLVEQYYQRPAMLQAFGWKIAHVYAKDWLDDRTYVLHQLLDHLK